MVVGGEITEPGRFCLGHGHQIPRDPRTPTHLCPDSRRRGECPGDRIRQMRVTGSNELSNDAARRDASRPAGATLWTRPPNRETIVRTCAPMRIHANFAGAELEQGHGPNDAEQRRTALRCGQLRRSSCGFSITAGQGRVRPILAARGSAAPFPQVRNIRLTRSLRHRAAPTTSATHWTTCRTCWPLTASDGFRRVQFSISFLISLHHSHQHRERRFRGQFH